jgi:hypothetical protein
VFYLKANDRNVDPSARISYPKTDRRSDRWIFENHNFCIWKISLSPLFSSLDLQKWGTASFLSFFLFLKWGACAPHTSLFFLNRRAIKPFSYKWPCGQLNGHVATFVFLLCEGHCPSHLFFESGATWSPHIYIYISLIIY